MKKIIILLFIFAVTLFACKEKTRKMEQKDKFYTEVSGWDYVRFPLIKPYSIWSLDKGESWSFNYPVELRKKFIIECIFGIKKVNVINNIFIFYCEEQPIIHGEKYPTAFFVFTPQDTIVKGFTDEKEFTQYAKECGVDKIEWKTPEECYKQFYDTKTLPWIPQN